MPDVDVAVVRDTTLLLGRGHAIDDSREIRLGVETCGKSHSKNGMRTRRRISYVLLWDALLFGSQIVFSRIVHLRRAL